jgi:hypothetical protein
VSILQKSSHETLEPYSQDSEKRIVCLEASTADEFEKLSCFLNYLNNVSAKLCLQITDAGHLRRLFLLPEISY